MLLQICFVCELSPRQYKNAICKNVLNGQFPSGVRCVGNTRAFFIKKLMIKLITKCSKPCGEDAIQTRDVNCSGDSIEHCDPNTIPNNKQNCIVKSCHEWIMGEWEQVKDQKNKIKFLQLIIF